MRWRTGCEIFGDKEQGAPPRDDTDASIMLPAAAKETSLQVSSKYLLDPDFFPNMDTDQKATE